MKKLIEWLMGSKKTDKAQTPAEIASEAKRPTTWRKISELTAAEIALAHNVGRNVNPGSFVHRIAEQDLKAHLAHPSICVVSLHGPSKQGKSTILRNVFDQEYPHLKVEAVAAIEPEELYRKLLAIAGVSVPVATTDSGNGAVSLTLPMVGGVAVGVSSSQQSEVVQGSLRDADWVSDVLSKVTTIKTIVIDSFHHFTEEMQSALAKDFTIFGGKGFKIVAAGTWRQGNYLVERNRDLRMQHRHVSVDPWSEKELEAVVRQGARALSVKLPETVPKALAKGAKGCVAALQLCCERYYDFIRTNHEAIRKGNDAQKANAAIVNAARSEADRMAEDLVRLSVWGIQDASSRHKISFVTEAMIAASPSDLSEGFTIDELLRRISQTETDWSRLSKKPPAPMSKAELAKKVNHDWVSHQIDSNTTPMFVWDRTIDRFVTNDSMLIFIHNTNRASLLSEFRNLMKEKYKPA